MADPDAEPADHSTLEAAGWSPALRVAELPEGQTAEIVVGDAIVALANAAGEIHAFDGMCAHQGGPLGKGKLTGCVLTCPWHGWQYDVATGRQLLSEHVRQRRYPVRLVGDTIWVRLETNEP